MVQRLLSLLTSSVLFGTAVLAQVPNGSFENWSDVGGYEDPDGWVSFNSTTIPLGGLSCEEGTPGAVGASYVRVSTSIIPDIGTIPGMMYTASTADGAEGFPHTERSATLNGQWMYNVTQEDMSLVTITLTRWNPETLERDGIGGGVVMAMGTQGTWQPFTLDITYESALDPDTASIFVISSASATPGASVISLDDLSFGSSTGIVTSAAPEFKIFPSPATDVLNITAGTGIAAVALLDLTGRQVGTATANGPSLAMDVAALPAGTYLARVRYMDGRVAVRTFVKK